MEKRQIAIEELVLQPFTTLQPDGVLLVSGAGVNQANVMTISWGTFGVMWGRPIAMVMVRPTRYTWDFITSAPDFTINWLPDDMLDALRLCGSASGRTMDKFAAAGLTQDNGLVVHAPILAESILTLECRTIYRDDVKPDHFLDTSFTSMYEANDYHGLFFGEVVAATGIDRFRCA
ncbi:MAG: flavin reductase family protein [Armatimonadota bacterium]